MKNGGDPATIKRWPEVANCEADPYRKSDFAVAVVLAQLARCEKVWQKALEGFNVLESVVVNEWKAQAAVEAIGSGIIRILRAKFDPLPPELPAKSEAVTAVNVLEDWLVRAGKAVSLDDFRRDAGV